MQLVQFQLKLKRFQLLRGFDPFLFTLRVIMITHREEVEIFSASIEIVQAALKS